MNFLSVFEDRISSVFESGSRAAAPFSFKKLAKKAAAELENETYIINGVDTAPALFTVLVSQADDDVMQPLYLSLTNETALFLEAHAQRRGYTFVGKPLVRFMVDPALKHGKFSVFAENIDGRTLERLRDEEMRYAGGEPVATPAPRTPPTTPAPDPLAASVNAGLTTMPDDVAFEVAPIAAPVPEAPVAPAQPLGMAEAPLPAHAARGAGHASAGARELAPIIPQEPLPNAQIPSPNVTPRGNVPLVGSNHGVPVAPVAPVPSAPDVAGAAMAGAAAGVAAGAAGAAAQGLPRTQLRNVPLVNSRQQHVPAPAAAGAILIDRQTGRTYTCTQASCIIGRERTPGGIVLHDPNVSRNHAELSYVGGTWQIRDLNSTNGTLVNDVDVAECALRDGDLLTFGLTNLEFRETR